MIHKIINQLNENDYSMLSLQMEEANAEKYLLLLNYYRNNNSNDKELISKLNIKPQAFYSLKSRLNQKVQSYLLKNTEETKSELIQNISKIDSLVYCTPRETAIQLLKKLEENLVKNDMPNELIMVYKALKKLHANCSKYNEYSRQYNKYVAYSLAQDKAEDILTSFCKTLSDFYLSRDKTHLLKLIMHKNEMGNVCRIYQSHRLKIYKNILDIQFALFVEEMENSDLDESIDEMLVESTFIVNSFKEDKVYRHLTLVIDFLYFEYYHQLKLTKKARMYYSKIVENTDTLLLLSHTCFSARFLLNMLPYMNFKSKNVDNEESNPINELLIDSSNNCNYILLNVYNASVLFYKAQYADAIQCINQLLREISFKGIPFIETELKLFLTLLYILSNEPYHASFVLRSASRKIVEMNDEKYVCANHFAKLLKYAFKDNRKTEKLEMLYNNFKVINTGNYKILSFIEMNIEMLLKINSIN